MTGSIEGKEGDNSKTCGRCGADLPASTTDATCSACALRLVIDNQSETPGTQVGPYTLLRKIGEGGMGMVYLAEQDYPIRRQVALKIVKLGMDTREIVARFEIELQAMAMLDHPNIAKVFDAGSTRSGRPYFAMELVQGTKITTFCDNEKLPIQERLRLFVPICQAIQHAHQKGIIHRDLKPSNILIATHGSRPKPIIIDFGIAKATGGGLLDTTLQTRSYQLLGTPAYMSPEQARFGEVDIDTRSDIYSLGVLLFELLCGRLPHEESPLNISGAVAGTSAAFGYEPLRPSARFEKLKAAEKDALARQRGVDRNAMVRQIADDLDWIVMKCLERDRARRYATAAELASDILRHTNSEPVLARPPTLGYRMTRAFRRHRAAFLATVGICCSILVGLVLTSLQAIRAGKAEEEQRGLRTSAEAAFRAEQVARRSAEIATKSERSAREAEAAERVRAQESEENAQRLLYAANLKLAQEAWERGDVNLLREVLRAAKDSKHRGFESDYWKSKLNNPLARFAGHGGSILSAAVSKSGRRVLSGSLDGTARLWDTKSSREIIKITSHYAPVYAVAFSPDGRFLLTGGGDRRARVSDSTNGDELLVMAEHRAPIRSVAFSGSGSRLVTAGGQITDRLGTQDTDGRVWDARTGELLLTLQGHRSAITSVAFSADDKWIVTAGHDEGVKVWDAFTGVMKWECEKAAREVAISEDSSRLAFTGSTTMGGIVLMNLLTGQELAFIGTESKIARGVGFTSDSVGILFGGSSGIVHEWSPSKPAQRSAIRADGEITCLALDPSGAYVFVGSKPLYSTRGGFGKPTEAFMGQLWSTKGLEVPPPCDQLNCVERLAIAADHSMAVSVSAEADFGSLDLVGRQALTPIGQVWEMPYGTELRRFMLPPGYYSAIAISPAKTSFAVTDKLGEATIFDINTGAPIHVMPQAQGWVTQNTRFQVAYSRNGRKLAVGSSYGIVHVWDTTTGAVLYPLIHRHGDIRELPPSHVQGTFCPDDTRVLSWGDDGEVVIWDGETGDRLLGLEKHTAAVQCAAYSSDGSAIVTGASDGGVRVFDSFSGRVVTAGFPHSAPVAEVAFHSTEPRVISRDELGVLSVSDATSGRELLRIQRPADFRLSGIARARNRFLSFVNAEAGGQFHVGEISVGAAPNFPESDGPTLAMDLPKTNGPLSIGSEIPPRGSDLPDGMIDLSRHYNASLQSSMHASRNSKDGNDLGSFPLGVVRLRGIAFDARGVVQLSSENLRQARGDYPAAVRGIKVFRLARRMHFLHGTGWVEQESNKRAASVAIANYVIRFKGGREVRYPVHYGRDVRDWNFFPERVQAEIGGAVPAWLGPQVRTKQEWPDWGVRLYVSTWSNPFPDEEIESVDLVSAMGASAPFVLAITID